MKTRNLGTATKFLAIFETEYLVCPEFLHTRNEGASSYVASFATLGWEPPPGVRLDKSEGAVKDKDILGSDEHRLLCQRRLRTKALGISR